MDQEKLIRHNYEMVLENIHQAAQSVGRAGDQIRLVVVTKGHPIPLVQATIAAGIQELGENYVEEAMPKMEAASGKTEITWHMIGHVQSRKAKPVCENFNWVHSVDRMKLARRMDRFAGEIGKKIPILLECNVSGEESKFGWSAWNELEWDSLAEMVSPIFSMENLMVRGLMTMAPYFDEPKMAQPYFSRLRKLRDFFAKVFPDQDWNELSMGMSGDYEAAIYEGATMLRIGTAILGEREN
jgi:pyridoxal phosphate enzyme (YggS family)